MKKLTSITLAVVTIFFLFSASLYAEHNIKVGIYQNRPQVFIDDEGNVKGIYIDILQYVAEQEDWNIEYVSGTWTQCLERLNNGEIDILVSIAYTEERDKIYNFTDETVLANWGQVYIGNPTIQSIVDLQDKRLAATKDDIYTTKMEELLKQFDIKYDLVEVKSYENVFELLSEGDVDAGLVPRIFGLFNEKDYSVEKSPIIHSPTELRFASLEERNSNIIQDIEYHLTKLKEDKTSIYYKSLNKWFADESVNAVIFSRWLIWALVVSGCFGFLFLGFNFILNERVKSRTFELQQEVSERKRAEDKLSEYQGHLKELVQARTEELALANHHFQQESIERRNMEKALIESEKRYKELSITDSLTGVYNVRHFYQQLNMETRRTDRYHSPMSIALLDVDNFKQYNDKYGHLEGDKILVELAGVIKKQMRATDSVYRYGGDEFIIILPSTQGAGVEEFAKRVGEIIEKVGVGFHAVAFQPEEGKVEHFTVSIGIAQYIEGEEVETLIKRADKGMYLSKKQGKDKLFCYVEPEKKSE